MGDGVTIPGLTEEGIQDLVRQCIDGNEVAWRDFDSRCRQILPAAIRGFRLPAEWVGEIVPDFLCYLFQDQCRVLRAYRPQPPAHFDSWLRVCFRRFTLRWMKTRPLPHWDSAVDPGAVLDAQQVAPCDDPHMLLGVSRIFDQLSDRERRLLSLSIQRYPYSEIGERLDMKEGAVAVAVQRLRDRLRVLLSAQVLELGLPRALSHGRRPSRPEV